MAGTSTQNLKEKTCQPCEGGVSALSQGEAEQLLQRVEHWELVDDGKQIRRQWKVKDFITGMDFLRRVAEIAESEGHHPDVHLTGYRNVTIEMSTHAIGGLSENDFILAAKIDAQDVAPHQGSKS